MSRYKANIQSAEMTSFLNSPTTKILSSDYPQDNDIKALLEENQYQYKWGGSLVTASTVAYSFANSETFVLDQEYRDSIWSYSLFVDDTPIIIKRLLFLLRFSSFFQMTPIYWCSNFNTFFCCIS